MIRTAVDVVAHLTVVGARTTEVGRKVFGDNGYRFVDDKVIFITGAARGLGAEIARQAHARGARVALVGRTLEPLQALADELGEGAQAFQADVTDLAALEKAVADAVSVFGRIDIVVANAGIAPPSDPLLTIDTAEFERTIDVDLLGQWRTVRATLPALIESKGHVLIVSSIYAFFNGALNASYAASKAGIEQLTRALRVEAASYGVTAGVAYLGFIDTDLARDVFAQAHIGDVRATMPAFITKPMPVESAAAAVLEGARRRQARVSAPGWVLPMLRLRSLTTWLMDEVMISNKELASIIKSAENR